MYFEDGHSQQPPDREKRERADALGTDPVEAISRMLSVKEFIEYCHCNNINMREQWHLIDEHGTDNNLLSFGKEMAKYKAELGETIFELSGVRMMSRVHRDDISPTPAGNTSAPSSEAFAGGDLPAYCLTPHGASIDSQLWDNLLNGIVELGCIEPKGVAEFRNLLGITRQSGRYKPLKEPVKFLSSKKMLAFLVSMMYGTMKYRLPCSVRVKNKVVPKGSYICQPLIVTPSGTGPDEQQHTRDAYWATVQQSVALMSPTGRKRAGSKHGFATSRKGDVPPEKAAPLLALLLPMGCHRVEE